jgi:hypothetical protein
MDAEIDAMDAGIDVTADAFPTEGPPPPPDAFPTEGPDVNVGYDAGEDGTTDGETGLDAFPQEGPVRIDI